MTRNPASRRPRLLGAASPVRRATVLAALLATLIAALATVPGSADPAGSGSFTAIGWTSGQAQPLSVSEAQGEVVGGRLLSFGGFDSQKSCCTPTNRAYAFDPATNAWTALRPMPNANGTAFGGVTHAGVATDGRDVFIAGGYTSDSSGTAQIFGTREVLKYDVAANTYSRLPDLPVARAGGQLEFLDGKLHFFGGTNQARTADVGDHYVLDLAGNATGWTTAAALPNPRHHMGSAVVGGRIYAIGGQHGHDAALTTQSSVHAYDPATNTWTARAPLPSARGHISSATIAYGGRILVFGGETANNAVINQVLAYDPAANSWQQLTGLPAPRRSGVAGAMAGRLYYTGGDTSGTYVGTPDITGLCEPVSDLACSDVKANVPLNLGFDGAAGGLEDKKGVGTGLTMTQPSANGGAFRPERVDVSGGALRVRTTAGIQYKTVNTLDNGLGLGVDARRKLRMTTTLVNPTAGTGASEQAGLWFGPDEDNYVKLAVISTGSTTQRVQLAREVAAASGATDELNSASTLSLSSETVRLTLVADPATGRVSGTYRIGTGAETSLGELTVPASFFDGTRVPANARTAGSTSFTGVYASHRNNTATTGLTYAFGELGVAEVATTGTPDIAASPDRIVVNDIQGGADGSAQTVTIRNTGSSTLNLSPMTLSGTDAAQFKIVQQPPATIAAGASATAQVAFAPTALGPRGATLTIPSDDPDTPRLAVELRGLGTAGEGGSNEPSLQWILDTHQVPVRTGDDDPATTTIHSVNGRAALVGEEIAAPTFRKAGTGPVTVEPLAIFGVQTTNPLVRFGHYTAGNAAAKTETFSVSNVPASNGQTVNVPGGLRSFEPGTGTFGLYTIWPPFSNREVFTEDALNTFSGAIPHHVRVFPYKDRAGGLVPNAYVVAVEEFTSGYDYNDIVAVVRNVQPAGLDSGAEIAVQNMDREPFEDRLAFNRIQNPNTSIPNGVHDTAVLRVRNTGDAPLRISSLSVSGPWTLVSPPATPASIPAGSQLDLTVRFTAQTGGTLDGRYEGSLSIASDDASEPTTVVQLGGFWQSSSENGQEPTVQEAMRTFGYGTTITSSSQTLDNGGRVTRVGDEVVSAYWKRGDTTRPVRVRQLAAFHTQGNTATVYTTDKATSTTPPPSQFRFRHLGVDGQSFFPRTDNAARTPGEVSFTPTQTVFGFRVDGEYSDWKVNQTGGSQNIDGACLQAKQTDATVQCGQHVRFWPIKDRQGALVKDAYLMLMDYAGINYDFNDNLYLVENVRPEDAAEDPGVCRPVACDKIAVTPPYELPFSAAVSGTVNDKDGQGTGFTYVDPPASGSGYLPANLDLDTAAGALRLTTTRGISYLANNSLDNALGVGIKWGSAAQAITTTIPNVPAGTGNNEQAGLWFGRDQDNYVKLVVISTAGGLRVEHMKEENAAVVPNVVTPALAIAGRAVELKLLAEPSLRRVTASYTVDGGAPVELGSYTVPPSWFSQDPEDPKVVSVGTSSFAGVSATHRNAAAPMTWTFGSFGVASDTARPRPSVVASRPADGATDVVRDVSVGTDLNLPNGGIDNATMTASTVRLVRDADGVVVNGTRGTSGGGDTIVFNPANDLEANTTYRFEVTDGLRDVSGVAFRPYTSRFTTGSRLTDTGSGTSTAAFDQVSLPTATSPYEFYTSLEMGPDGRLYAAMSDGRIRRWPVNADGTLGTATTIASLVPGFNEADDATKRLALGLHFDPASTAANPIAWVTHTTYGFDQMPDWGGKLTRLSGASLQTAQDYVVGLPRSVRDHATNGIDIGPDGKIYLNQGSNSAMGAPDAAWENRPERTLSAAVLRVDPAKITNPPLNVKTAEGGTYDPFAAGAPVTVFGSGVRNAYDLVWHTNGKLYVPTNGSAAGGNAPGTPSTLPASCSRRVDAGTRGAYTGPSVPALSNVNRTQNDFLFRVSENGYYGHPNPTRCEWVLNGGNPTSGSDPAEVAQYPAGTQPDRNWRGAAFDFGTNKSPNGVIEYRSDRFGGTLKGKLLVVRYSQDDDVIALTPDTAGDIGASQTAIPGLTGFKDPIDLVEDPATGNLYVSEYDQLGTGQRIRLLRARDTAPAGCAPYSTVACDDVDVSSPRTLSWTADEGGLKDGDGTGTGFTMTQPSSNGGAFRPERVDAASGSLTITSTRGIQYKTATTTTNGNSLDNGLGVGFDASRAQRIETTMVNPPLGTASSEQGGLWFGPGEDDYVKLVIQSVSGTNGPAQRVQLARERGGVAVATNDPATTDELNTAPMSGLSTQSVKLTLEANPTTRRVSGTYQVGSGAVQALGSLEVPASFFDGSLLGAGLRGGGTTGLAGIFASHRNNVSTLGLPFRFGRFAIAPVTAPVGDPVIAAVGDIACDPNDPSFNGGAGTATNCRHRAVADLLDGTESHFLALGDLQYEQATSAKFAASYDPAFGKVKSITRPVPGDHEYDVAGAADYFTYFNGASTTGPAGERGKGWYSFDAGRWHVVALNTNCADDPSLCVAGGAQETWLKADLAAHPNQCTLAFSGNPMVSSGTHGGQAAARPLFDALLAGGTDVLLSGDDHDYERFASVRPDGTIDRAGGMRQFVVGTGGKSLRGFREIVAGSGARNEKAYGLLKLTLKENAYSWRFASVAGETFSDTGTDSCDGALPDTQAPSVPTGLRVVDQSGASALTWTASTDDDGVGGYRVFRNGVQIGTSSRPSFTHTATPDPAASYHVVAVDAAGNASAASGTAKLENRAPRVTTPADQANGEGDAVGLTVTGTDPDGHALTWSATGLPAGLTISPSTGRISGTLAAGSGRTAPYAVTVTATDDGSPAKSTSVGFGWTVTAPAPPADTTAPTVDTVRPASGATGVSTGADVQAVFSEAMDPASITGSTFTLRAGTTAVAAAVTWSASDRTATLDPSAALAAGTTYTATVAGTVRDTAGNAMGTARTWTFTTATATTPPPAGTGVRINMGGPAQTVDGVAWQACETISACRAADPFNGYAYVTSPLPASISGVTSPASAALYHSAWIGGEATGTPVGARAFGLNIAVPSGSYRVRLHFTENSASLGRRLFDVNLEAGPLELSRFDIFAESGGLNRALVREFPVSVADGVLDADFFMQVGNAKINAIEVLQSTVTTSSSTSATTLSLTDASEPTAGAARAAGGRRARGLTVRGRMLANRRGVAKRRVVIERATKPGRPFRAVAVTSTRADGTFRATLRSGIRSGLLRAVFAGDATARPARSKAATVTRLRRAGAAAAARAAGRRAGRAAATSPSRPRG